MLEDLGFLVKFVRTSVHPMQICSPALVPVSLSALLQVLLRVSLCCMLSVSRCCGVCELLSLPRATEDEWLYL